MGWLDDLETDLKYRCSAGHEQVITKMASECKDFSPVQCDYVGCTEPAQYNGMLPREVSMINKVAYDQNGRLAYKISDGKGASSYISKTKYDYLQTGVVKSAYTRDYERHVVASGDAKSLEATDLTKMKKRPSGGIRELMNDAKAKEPKSKPRGESQ